jgi:hypothetical protein
MAFICTALPNTGSKTQDFGVRRCSTRKRRAAKVDDDHFGGPRLSISWRAHRVGRRGRVCVILSGLLQADVSEPRRVAPARARPDWLPHPRLLVFSVALWTLAGAVQAMTWLRH